MVAETPLAGYQLFMRCKGDKEIKSRLSHVKDSGYSPQLRAWEVCCEDLTCSAVWSGGAGLSLVLTSIAACLAPSASADSCNIFDDTATYEHAKSWETSTRDGQQSIQRWICRTLIEQQVVLFYLACDKSVYPVSLTLTYYRSSLCK